MKEFLIKGENSIGKSLFAKKLAQKLSDNNKIIIIEFERSPKENIEDYFDMAGMISYDIADHFLNYTNLNRLIKKACDNIDIIISPFVKDKYEIKKQDIEKLIKELDSYDIGIFIGLEEAFLNQCRTIEIISENQVDKNINSDFYFINKCTKEFDPRVYKELLEAKPSKYLGFVRENETFDHILDNLINNSEEKIEKIGFFEKIRMKFK